MLRQPALLALLLTVFVGRANALTYMAGYEPLNDMTERAEMDLDLVAMIGTPSTDSWMLGGECAASCSLSASCTNTVYASGTGCYFTGSTMAWPETTSAKYTGATDGSESAYTIWKYGYQSDAGARNFYGFANAMTAGKSSGSGTDMRENKWMKIMNTYWAFKGLGQYSWPVEMIAGAFEGNTVGAVNFAKVGRDYRVQAIKKGTVYMNVFPYIIWELQDAANDCRGGRWASERGKAWDEGLAFYAGSTIGTRRRAVGAPVPSRATLSRTNAARTSTRARTASPANPRSTRRSSRSSRMARTTTSRRPRTRTSAT